MLVLRIVVGQAYHWSLSTWSFVFLQIHCRSLMWLDHIHCLALVLVSGNSSFWFCCYRLTTTKTTQSEARPTRNSSQSFNFFSSNRLIGPIWSSSRDVRLWRLAGWLGCPLPMRFFCVRELVHASLNRGLVHASVALAWSSKNGEVFRIGHPFQAKFWN